MNNILQLKGQFQKRKAPSGFGPTNLPKGKSVSAEHVLKLKDQLQDIILFWNQEKTINGALVSVHYRKVVAKSNRLQLLLSDRGKHPNESVRGSKFSQGYRINVQLRFKTFTMEIYQAMIQNLLIRGHTMMTLCIKIPF